MYQNHNEACHSESVITWSFFSVHLNNRYTSRLGILSPSKPSYRDLKLGGAMR